MADLDAIHTRNRVLRTIYPAGVPRVILSIGGIERACPNRRHVTASSVV